MDCNDSAADGTADRLLPTANGENELRSIARAESELRCVLLLKEVMGCNRFGPSERSQSDLRCRPIL